MACVDETIRIPRYDGRSKKRKWEERRTDTGEALDVKKPSLDAPKQRRRKYAVLLGYSGVNFLGMQRNPGTETIEEAIFRSLLECEYIQKEQFDQIQTIQFQRAARTDKGVSAAQQVISLKLPEIFQIDKINEHLPETIRVFGSRRVTKGFNSKSQCDARTYTYILPTAAFCDKSEDVKQSEYTLSESKLQQVNEVLGNFVGTKNFHNYTSKKRFNDPSATRYIMSFTCEDRQVFSGTEFVTLRVKGQSFMMHHIRKMVGLTIAILRGYADMEMLKKSFTNERVNVPKAPGLGLMLDFVHYQRYNQRYGADHPQLLWEEEKEDVKAFCQKYIYPTIFQTEINEESMMNWVKVLDIHGYDVEEEEVKDEKTEPNKGENNDKSGNVSD